MSNFAVFLLPPLWFPHQNRVTGWDLSIAEKDLDQIEFLLAQSMNGIHMLFDNETIRRTLKETAGENDFFRFENMDKIQTLFSELIKCESIDGKRAYLARLAPKEFEMLLRTYFHILDNSLLAAKVLKH